MWQGLQIQLAFLFDSKKRKAFNDKAQIVMQNIAKSNAEIAALMEQRRIRLDLKKNMQA